MILENGKATDVTLNDIDRIIDYIIRNPHDKIYGERRVNVIPYCRNAIKVRIRKWSDLRRYWYTQTIYTVIL